MAKCAKCKASPRRARGQRWCHACHAADQRRRYQLAKAMPLAGRLASVCRRATEYPPDVREQIARVVTDIVATAPD